MGQINPFAGAIAQTPQAQRLAAADRDAQLRKTHTQQRATGYTDQNIDEYVESADAVEPVGDQPEHPDQQKKKQKRSPSNEPEGVHDDAPHIDVRA